ncbi:MAG: alpha/beta hydrolase [Actinobacteria bacterium]|nr:alpha/beta hydrolase [Actinomycetota bacterium]
MPSVVTEDGVDIAWYDFGGDGPDLLLAHATGFHGRVWLPVVERLPPHFRCVAFDERGHGDSGSPADGDFDWHGFARDAAAVVEAAGLDRPFGVGHSCGAAALLLAEEARPGSFRALYCYEPVVNPSDSPQVPAGPTPLAEGARRRREVFDSREAAYERYASKPPTAAFTAEALRAYVDFGFDDLPGGGVRLKCRGEAEARTYEHGFAHDAYRRLGRVRCPVTLAYGGSGAAFGREVMEAMAARLGSARIEEATGLSHFGPLEGPTAVAAAVVRAFTPA